ncbi:putative BNR repeat neuraminidase [Altererythrobacter ishigakiensis]|uniref:Putative BNR repeat neuraminidase n=2 Tax=Altererythrobacter ishigakiensis TaxID=476157 RepID=A0A562UM28_9SPHN|nr:BNR-4 repeat-containing protein [Altererythrobacter ishigakiensis]TWJ06669.1 putative BNR repeat neuraminidase [Altererythrobacter ishigakiensis]
MIASFRLMASAFSAVLMFGSISTHAAGAENAERAYITGWDELAAQSHTSDGMERSRDGKPRFVGPLGARAVSYNGFQYVVFYSGRDRTVPREEAASYVVVARRKLGGFAWEYSVLEDYEVTSDDAHNRQTIAISEGDGRIHISFDHHNRPKMNYAVTAPGVATDPDYVVWNNEVFTYTENLGRDPDERLNVTYPSFSQFPGGNLIVYFRSGGSYGGEMRLARYDAAIGRWGEVRNISSRHGTFDGKETTRGPYLGDAKAMQVGPDGSLHASWVFRERPCDYTTSSRSEIFCNHGLFYAKSLDEGRTWLRTDGSQIADTEQGETISIDNIGGPVIEVPKGLGPSNPSITSTVDQVTGEMHTLLRHLDRRGGKAFYYHYLGRSDGTWRQTKTNFDGNTASLAVVGERLYAFVGRDKGQIYYAERQDEFRKWNRLPIEIDKKRKFDPQGGFITWDLSAVAQGKVSLLWHREPESRGLSSPLQIFDISLE